MVVHVTPEYTLAQPATVEVFDGRPQPEFTTDLPLQEIDNLREEHGRHAHVKCSPLVGVKDVGLNHLHYVKRKEREHVDVKGFAHSLRNRVEVLSNPGHGATPFVLVMEGGAALVDGRCQRRPSGFHRSVIAAVAPT